MSMVLRIVPYGSDASARGIGPGNSETLTFGADRPVIRPYAANSVIHYLTESSVIRASHVVPLTYGVSHASQVSRHRAPAWGRVVVMTPPPRDALESGHTAHRKKG